jgi:hypothetical protein
MKRFLVIIEKAAGVTDRPNGARHDRAKGATWKWRFWGLGEGHRLVFFTSFHK